MLLCVLIGFVWILMAAGCSEPSTGSILLVNNSSSLIVRAEVNVCDNTLQFEGIKPRDSQHSFFYVDGECQYAMTVNFADQPPLRAQLGTLTTGFDWVDYLVVTDAEIQLNPKGYKGTILRH